MMKYTIEGFSQEYAMTLRKEVEVNGKKVMRKIDCTDLVILRWFVDFYPNMKKIEVDGNQYAWLTHKKLEEDLPLVDITRKAFIERMQKLVDFEILTYRLIKEGGTFSLYGFGANYRNMIENPVSIQTDAGCTFNSTGGVRSNVHGVSVQTDNKDISIIDSSIIDSSNKDIGEKRKRFVPPTLEEVKAYCIERKNNVDADRFIDYYTANGWQVGKNKMKDWKAAVRTWERNGFSDKTPNNKNSSFDTEDFFQAAVSRSYGTSLPRTALEREVVSRGEEKAKNPPKTAGEDEAVREKMEQLKERLGI